LKFLGHNPQIGRPLSRIVGAIGLFGLRQDILLGVKKRKNKPSEPKTGIWAPISVWSYDSYIHRSGTLNGPSKKYTFLFKKGKQNCST
jgi:hypothetical protein